MGFHIRNRIPAPIRKDAKEKGLPEPGWYVGSAEGAWGSSSIKDWAEAHHAESAAEAEDSSPEEAADDAVA